jgi:microcystin-dependent protein
MRCYALLPYGWYLECTTDGITGSGDITIPSPLNVGDTVTDGAVVWTIRKIGSGDGFAVGDIIMIAGNNTIRDGWIECDGRAVSRTMFPDLFDAIGTTYGAGDGSTTFNLPNYSDGKFPEGSTVAGTVKQPGLPNITGMTGANSYADLAEISGAFRRNSTTHDIASAGSAYPHDIEFNAAWSNPIYGASNTVQPYSLTTRFIIKAYDGVTPTPAEADISEMLTELTNKADRALSNLSNDGKQTIIDYNMPDYDNGIAWSYPTAGAEKSYTAPSDGWVAYTLTGGANYVPGTIKINSNTVFEVSSASTSFTSTFSGIVRVQKNDTIYVTSAYDEHDIRLTRLIFYPNKEVIV